MRKFSQKMKNNPCPSLVTLEDCFRTDRDIYIAMELCEGGTLENYLKNRKLDEREAVEILRSISTGLEYMAGMEIAHRDLKPENIFIAI
jgi:serine/threonine protein kinase